MKTILFFYPLLILAALTSCKKAGGRTPLAKGITDMAKGITDMAKGITAFEGDVQNATLSEEDPFSWDNVMVYFVITDRYYNGKKSNDNSYHRVNKGIPPVASFHGGDIAGLTKKLPYIASLGVTALWITAPYEQVHGWTSGKGGRYPHYAFHGYYAQDWTALDRNIGTVEEFRAFVNACHEKGIRVIMDVVMNHTGYCTVEDMMTYHFGAFKEGVKVKHGWAKTDGGKWDLSGVIDYNSIDWSKWWGGWTRGFSGRFGYVKEGTDNITMSLAGLPDIVTERTENIAIPAFLREKWARELSGASSSKGSISILGKAMDKYAIPAISNVDWAGMAGDWREDNKGAPADYITTWLSAWVREFGIDGFRIDTAKHVHLFRWGELKDKCNEALRLWRLDDEREKGRGAAAALWTDGFWTVGESFGWTQTTRKSDYYSIGKFDSMINFSFNAASGKKGRLPTVGDWGRYAANPDKACLLSYVSSHDTGLHRKEGAFALGTMLCLLPGGIQVYYGDESERPETDGMGDADMMTRGDMNFLPMDDPRIEHWRRLGLFRKYNKAVGAGEGDAMCRTYIEKDGTKNHIAIGIEGERVRVGEGMKDTARGGQVTVYNWYDGTSSIVQEDGTAYFPGSIGTIEHPILMSNKRPNSP